MLIPINKRAIYKGYIVDVVHEQDGHYYTWTSSNKPFPDDLLIEMRTAGMLEYTGKIRKDAPDFKFI
jgi:hypothetical protein